MALLAVFLLAPSARAACTPTSPPDDANVVCTGTDSTGYDGSGANNLTITTGTDAVLDDSDPGLDAAILVDDESSVTIGQDATVNVTQQNGAGIRGDDDNFIQNLGRIVLSADDTRGISIDQNTTDNFTQGNGVINSGTIQVNGNRSYAIETDNAGISTSGTINLIGDETRGISAGNRSDLTKRANATNSGTITVKGDDSFGLKFGDNWTDGSFQNTDNDVNTPDVFVPTAAGIRNQQGGIIRVTGNGSTGIFAGDEANFVGNHNSFVLNSGTIAVAGTDGTDGIDGIGVSVGGNDRLDRFDLSTVNLNTQGTFGLVTLNNSGSITGAANSGPLVVFRDFAAGHENRLLNSTGASIVADLTNQGTADRGTAIRGSDGDELIINLGQIKGDVDLRGGDDRYFHRTGAQLTGNLIGGSGQDEVTLAGTSSTSVSFNVGQLQGFEALRITRGSPLDQNATAIWSLTNTSGFNGLVEVQNTGLLDVPTPITLGGDFTVAEQGGIRVTLDSTTPPLTVQGSTNLDGTLVVIQGPNLTPSATPYRVVLANGGLNGQFSEILFPSASGTRIFTSSYDALGVLALFQDVGLVGVAHGSNQRAIAQNLVDLTNAGGSSADLQNLLDNLTDFQNLGSVYNALSPEAYDAQTTVSIEAGRHIAALLFDRPRNCQTGDVEPWDSNHRALPCHEQRVTPWAATLGTFRSRDKFDGHNRYDAQLGGLIAGVDVQPLADLGLTFAVSSQHGNVNVASAGESTLTLAELTAAAVLNEGPFRAQGVVTWGHGFHDDRRHIAITDSEAGLPVTADENHESDRALLATEIGYQVPVGPVGVEPLVGVDWAWMIQDEIHESGAGGFGLDVDSRNDQVGSVRAGVRLSSVYEHKAYLGPWLEWMTGIWRPSFDLAWRQYVEGNQRDLDARLQGGPGSVGGFTIQGKEDDGGAEIGLGFRMVPKYANRLHFDVRYKAYVAVHTLEQDLTGQIGFSF